MNATVRQALVVENRLPVENPAGGIRLGLVRAEDVDPAGSLPELDAAIQSVETGLDARREALRLAARDMLRNGRYKPTGRGKPASEYLLRTAAEGTFPRINAVVDINNLVSVRSALPISLWDLDRAEATHYVFRLGGDGEAYVFNVGGQTLDLHDLAVGCRKKRDDEAPIVSPIKDSHATKTTPDTRRVAASIYAPVGLMTQGELHALCQTFADWLRRCGAEHTRTAVAGPGETVEL